MKKKQDPQKQNLDIMATLRGFSKYIGSDKRRLILACIITVINVAVYVCSTLVLQPIINNYIEPGELQGLIYAIGLFMLIGITDIITMFIILRLFIRVGQNVSFRMREALFDKMQMLPLKFFDTRSQGELMSHYTNDMEQVSLAFEQSVNQLLASVLTFVFIIIAMFVMNWKLALVSCVSLVITFFFSGRITSQSKKSFIHQQRDIGKLNGYINELYSGEKVVKAFNYEDRAEEHFSELNETYRKSSSRAQIFSGMIWPVAANLNNLNYAAVVIVGAILILSPGNTFTIGGLIAFLIFVRMLTRPLQQVGQQLSTVFNALAGASRVFSVINEEPEVDNGKITLEKDTHQKNTWNWVVPDTPKKMIPLRGEVDFNDVTFSYDGEHPVLRNVSLYAKAGQKIAFVGSTGAGKTTITNLINRFYDVQEGSITYDGINVKDIKKDDLRHSLGIVLQDTNLFTGTIADNIRYGNLDASEEAVVAAAQRAGAHSFIERLPDGYQTVITANGSSLSQGQRQLLAIARAAVADPPVLILDEATSSVDTRTEKMIERGMDALMENRTVFVIAHRLSTVRNADAIMVLDHGRIIERGNHEDLIEKQGVYWDLYNGNFELE